MSRHASRVCSNDAYAERTGQWTDSTRLGGILIKFDSIWSLKHTQGGYDIVAVSQSIQSCLSVLLGDQTSRIDLSESIVSEDARNVVDQVVTVHKHYWDCFTKTVIIPKRPCVLKSYIPLRGILISQICCSFDSIVDILRGHRALEFAEVFDLKKIICPLKSKAEGGKVLHASVYARLVYCLMSWLLLSLFIALISPSLKSHYTY
jgi:hypothetical protein